MNLDNNKSIRVAVVGGGVAGIVSAYLLQQQHQVTLFDQNDYLGGHTNTIEIKDGPDAGLAVDTGFIVLNDATYPLFQKFLARLDVQTRISEMSFGFQCLQSGLVYAGNDLNGLFARIHGQAQPLTRSSLLKTIIRHPLSASLTMPRLLWQAAKLYCQAGFAARIIDLAQLVLEKPRYD